MCINTIKNCRREKGYSQEYMAFCLEMSQNSYCRIELGQTELTITRLLEICKILDIDPHALIEEYMHQKSYE